MSNLIDKWGPLGFLENSRDPEELAQILENTAIFCLSHELEYRDQLLGMIFPIVIKLNNEYGYTFVEKDFIKILNDIKPHQEELQDVNCSYCDPEKVYIELYCQNYKR